VTPYRGAVALFSRGRSREKTAAAQAAAIDAFWAWWRDTGSAAFAAAIADGEPARMVDDISGHVHAIHPELAWETGPGILREHTLTVTAEGNPELRAVARRWLRAAPVDPVWDFADARQPSPGLDGLAIGIEDHTIDVESVRVTARVEGFEADVVVYHPAFPALPAETRAQLAFILLDSALGEVAVETWIGAITPATVEPLDAFPLAGLTAVVRELATRSVSGDGEPTWLLLQGQAPDGSPVIASAQVPLKAVTAPELDTYVRVEVPYADRNEGGLPGPGSLAALRGLEEHVTARLEGSGRVLAHETHAGTRVLHVYVDGSTPAPDQVKAAVTAWDQGPVQVQTSPDPGWRKVAHLRG
jgi:hypothetical protein